MPIFKKAKDIGAISAISLFIGSLLYLIFRGVVGVDFNTLFLYRDNYSNPSGDIVIIKIDPESIDELQKTDFRMLSLSKTVYVHLIENLEKLGARAIGIDVVFTNHAEDEDILRKTLERYKNVVIGAWMEEGKQKAILPLDIYSGATWASVNTKIEKNVVTILEPQYSFSGRTVESLAIATYRKYLGDTSLGSFHDGTSFKNGTYQITPLRSIPVDSEKNVRIKFFRPPEGYPSYSLSDILHDRVPREKIAGKAILVGEYGTLIHDAHWSPVDPENQMPGVEFHANLLDGLIQDETLEKQSVGSFLLCISGLLLLLSIVFYLPSTFISALLFCLYEIFILFVGRYLLGQSGIFIDLFTYAIVGLSVFISAAFYRYFVTNKDRRYIEKAFSHYIAPDVVKQIALHPDSFKLGGEKREMTFFFSDIASFTTISEKLGTEKVFRLMEEYLSAMTDILISNKGTLDKYIGDAVMGFFNAPIRIEKSEYLACKTALEQQAQLTELNWKWEKEGIPYISVRIGIDTGEAMVGNIGSKDRFNYTVIGDHVNLASRLEGVNKEYLTKICVSENTFRKTKDDFFYRELDTIRVKGKVRGVKIYELIGYLNDPSINREKYSAYEKALALYYVGEYRKAQDIFSLNTEDLASAIMTKRCQDALDGKIEVINGVYEMKTK
ncbi:MAG: adenylate/guanylate cyclase domain-containing protein [Candidatus Gracilibacteria bacterium]|nr:adenylate/guanylate cyclase domain-containing protein [Candidatus Gracilibacteria bacterium]